MIEIESSAQARLPSRLLRLLPHLCCPRCKQALQLVDKLHCACCQEDFLCKNGKVYFSQPSRPQEPFDSFKHALKRKLGRWYWRIGVAILGPTLPYGMQRTLLRYHNPTTSICVDLGSGNYRLHQDVVTVDCADYPEVDIVCDAANLPFLDSSVDCFCSRSVLEHVDRPFAAGDEIERCTKHGGTAIIMVPLLFPFHASPDDFWRFTHSGIQLLLPRWNVVEQHCGGGPISAALALFYETFSQAVSFGSSHVRQTAYLLCCLLLFPLKFLDYVFVKSARFMNVASSTVTIFRKE